MAAKIRIGFVGRIHTVTSGVHGSSKSSRLIDVQMVTSRWSFYCDRAGTIVLFNNLVVSQTSFSIADVYAAFSCDGRMRQESVEEKASFVVAVFLLRKRGLWMCRIPPKN